MNKIPYSNLVKGEFFVFVSDLDAGHPKLKMAVAGYAGVLKSKSYIYLEDADGTKRGQIASPGDHGILVVRAKPTNGNSDFVLL